MRGCSLPFRCYCLANFLWNCASGPFCRISANRASWEPRTRHTWTICSQVCCACAILSCRASDLAAHHCSHHNRLQGFGGRHAVARARSRAVTSTLTPAGWYAALVSGTGLQLLSGPPPLEVAALWTLFAFRLSRRNHEAGSDPSGPARWVSVSSASPRSAFAPDRACCRQRGHRSNLAPRHAPPGRPTC